MIDKRLPLFKIASNIFESITLDDVDRTFHDMHTLGIFYPPFNHFSIQANAMYILNLMRQDFKEEMDLSLKDGETIRKKKQIMFEYVYKDSGLVTYMSSSEDGSNFFDMPRDFYEGKQGEMSKFLSLETYKLLIVLLSTKNIKKETETCNKPNSRNRRERTMSKYASVTTIKIGTITETARSSNGNGSPVRPHLRRGHIRSQPYGKGKSEVKRIFIQPMFINADQGWINSQKEYRVTA